MKSTIFDWLFKPLAVTILCVFLAILQAFAFKEIVDLRFLPLCLFSGVDMIIFAGLCMLLSQAVRFGNYVVLDLWQRLINYLALCVLFIGIWIGLEYLIAYFALGSNGLLWMNRFVSLKIFIAILLFLVVMQMLHGWKDENNTLPEASDEQDDLDDAKNTPDEISENATERLERVVVKIGQKIHVVLVPDIVYLQADGDYVQIFTQSEKFMKEDTMKYFQAHLPEHQFVRVHRSYLVNIEKIHRVELYEKQTQQLSLSNGHKIRISASGYKRLREALNL